MIGYIKGFVLRFFISGEIRGSDLNQSKGFSVVLYLFGMLILFLSLFM